MRRINYFTLNIKYVVVYHIQNNKGNLKCGKIHELTFCLDNHINIVIINF